MKIDRIIGIITVLQRKGKVTMSYLAEKFEVSRRTIARDIETICGAGIPIVSFRGTEGGVEIMDGFNLDTTVFTRDELQAVLAGLKALESVSAAPTSSALSDKLYGKDAVIPLDDSIMIDLSSFHKDSLSEKINMLKKAAREKKCVTFHYYYSRGEDDKLIEPLLVVFKWSSWYIFGFCPERSDFRMYKLDRLWDLRITDQGFEQRSIPAEKLDFGRRFTDEYVITALFEPSEKYKLVEEYGPCSFTSEEDGRLYTKWGFCDYDNALNWYMSFGDKVEILGPEDFKRDYIERLERALKRNKQI
ncbi:MAG: YafY family transcriptional regulator [Bacteroides sp.]|nr:YafY family transcriptional regulator [Bacteroides sp.]